VRARLTATAENDLAGIYTYYAERSGAAADRVVGVILKAIRGLGRYPRMGKSGHYPDTREHFTTRYPYRIVYRIDEDAGDVYVLRIMHGARQWLPDDVPSPW